MARRLSTREREVVVIGGGVMGLSTAYQLARAGVAGITVLEMAELGSGSSAKPLGGVRALFSDRANIALGARSLEAFRRFDADFGVDIGLREVGYLFAIRDAADLPGFEQGIAVQNELGVATRLVDPAEAVQRCPYLSPSAVLAAIFSPGGYARPADVIRGYAKAATDRGVEIRTHAPLLAIEPTADGRARLQTDDAAYVSCAVVCAAGAWSGRVAAMAGVQLPVEPLRRQIAFSPPLNPRPPEVPFTIDYSTTAYFHCSADGGLLMGWANPREAPGFGRDVSTDWHADLRAALRLFAPGLADVAIHDGWAGLYEMTPDCNAVIGETDAGFRFLYAAGFSGHGFLQAPAVGECIRDLFLRRRPVVDVSDFDLARFDRPVVRTELGII